MRWGWVGGSAAAACAVVALVLYLSDLETLSWIAGAGSFVAAVPSLVLALTQEHRSAPTVRTAGRGQERESAHRGDAAAVPEVFELTTAWGRIAKRILGTILGSLGVVGFFLLVCFASMVFGDQSLEQVQAELLEARLYVAGLAVMFAVAGGLAAESTGRDLLIVDPYGLTVVDKRWVRFKNGSFSLLWEDLERIRAIAARKGSSLLVEVRFKRDADARTWLTTQDNGETRWRQDGGWYVVAALSLSTGRAEQTALVPVLRSSLARNAGEVYSGS
ncbi:hypothetical protein ACF07Q_19545 [Nocardiopsis dassonvillei]|uniref:hypothetical protein n=1 Tax=Nocardiopsis dassonvillei TaxID=2014 RepID=UPI0037024443